MRRTAFDEARDERIANDAGVDSRLMCSAHGCPNRWSTSQGNLCTAHADADCSRWPEVTQAQQWAGAERARMRGEPESNLQPMTRAEKVAVLEKLRAFGAGFSPLALRDPKAWAHELRDREQRGERLSTVQREAWREALAPHSRTRLDEAAA